MVSDPKYICSLSSSSVTQMDSYERLMFRIFLKTRGGGGVYRESVCDTRILSTISDAIMDEAELATFLSQGKKRRKNRRLFKNQQKGRKL